MRAVEPSDVSEYFASSRMRHGGRRSASARATRAAGRPRKLLVGRSGPRKGSRSAPGATTAKPGSSRTRRTLPVASAYESPFSSSAVRVRGDRYRAITTPLPPALAKRSTSAGTLLVSTMLLTSTDRCAERPSGAVIAMTRSPVLSGRIGSTDHVRGSNERSRPSMVEVSSRSVGIGSCSVRSIIRDVPSMTERIVRWNESVARRRRMFQCWSCSVADGTPYPWNG